MARSSKTLVFLFFACLACAVLVLAPAQPTAARQGSDDGGGNSGSGSGGSGSGGSGGGGGDDDGGGERGGKELKLRVNDAIGVPGGTVAVVLRTYAARPIRQGQIGLRVRRRQPARQTTQGSALSAQAAALSVQAQPAQPVASLVSAVVFSQRGDSQSQASLAAQSEQQKVVVGFQSPSGTVNASDGPLAVVRLRLDPAVVPGQEYDLEIDPLETSLVDAQGRPLTLEPIAATLTVRAPGAPFEVEAEGDEVSPGETAELGFSTFEPFASAGGRIALRYAPRVAAGPPVVRMDPRYGNATFTVDTSTKGLVVVAFRSPDRTLNTVPGRLVDISLPIRATVAPGSRTRLVLDPEGTWLLARRGRKVKLAMEQGELLIE